jgi:hypothetical protein
VPVKIHRQVVAEVVVTVEAESGTEAQ